MAAERDGGRTPEVVAALATAFGLIIVEAILFDADRVREDLGDIVGLCAFGGGAATVLKDRLHSVWASREAASAVLGLAAALVVFHGTRNDVAPSDLLTPFGAPHWWVGRSLIVAGFVGLLAFVTGEVVQGSARDFLVRPARAAVRWTAEGALIIPASLAVSLLIGQLVTAQHIPHVSTDLILAISLVLLGVVLLVRSLSKTRSTPIQTR